MEEERNEAQAPEASGEKPEEAIVEFDIQIGSKDLFNFMLRHNYASLQGILGVMISLAALIYMIADRENMYPAKLIALIVIALLFTVVNPLMLRFKAVQQVKRNKTFAIPIHYALTEAHLVISQKEEQVEIPWDSILKVKDTGRSYVVYVSRIRAFIWPKAQIANYREKVLEVFAGKVSADKLKFKK